MTVTAEYKASPEFTRLAPSSRRAYLMYIKLIENEFGDPPLAALADRRVRGEFKTWRDSFAETPRKADYAWTTLARIMSFAKDLGTTNPCEKGGRLYAADRTDKVWADRSGTCSRFSRHQVGSRVGALDQPAARRPAAATLVGVRRQSPSASTVEDRATHRNARRHATKGPSRRHRTPQPFDLDELVWPSLDL
jgi:hypothetical protein